MMKTYKELYKIVEEELGKLKYPAEPKELYEPVSYMMLLGGKRLRPVLVLMANDLFNGNADKAVSAALAVEMFHNFTLVHDDIMDNADLRRGKPTVHTRWNQTIAILSGDLMMIKATDLLAETPTNRLADLMRPFNKTAAEVCEGQQIDMNFETRDDVSTEEYIHMITLKTAVLLGGALRLGAQIAGASAEDAEYLYNFGKNIGIAFQVQDDLLDAFGEGDQVGKKIGGDIAANKKTLLLIEALRNADEATASELRSWLKVQGDDDKKIAAVLGIYQRLEVKAAAEQLKEKYLQEAFKNLDLIGVDEDRKRVLRYTAIDLMQRMS